MKIVTLAYLSGRITEEEATRYRELHGKLMGSDSFVEPDNTPEWDEFNVLTKKIMG